MFATICCVVVATVCEIGQLKQKKAEIFISAPNSLQLLDRLVQIDRSAAVLRFFHAVAGLNHKLGFTLA